MVDLILCSFNGIRDGGCKEGENALLLVFVVVIVVRGATGKSGIFGTSGAVCGAGGREGTATTDVTGAVCGAWCEFDIGDHLGVNCDSGGERGVVKSEFVVEI